MWFRVGSWIELGVHFGSPNRPQAMPGRYLIHASLRWGEREWYGPARLNKTAHQHATSDRVPLLPVHFRSKLEQRPNSIYGDSLPGAKLGAIALVPAEDCAAHGTLRWR